jgi:hypothetical protein
MLYDNEYDNYCFRQELTEVHKERPPQQIVNRKRTMNSDFYDLRLETQNILYDMRNWSYIPEGNVFHNYVTSVLATKLYQLSSSTYPDKPC